MTRSIPCAEGRLHAWWMKAEMFATCGAFVVWCKMITQRSVLRYECSVLRSVLPLSVAHRIFG